MKTIILFISLLVSSSLAYADELGINIELSRVKQGQTWQTLVSIRAGYLTSYNRDNIPVETAAKVIRTLKFDEDSKFAVIHSNDAIPVTDLIPIFEAMRANDIATDYIQIGKSPPSGMDIWNHK
jgi:hypothetical protein